MKGSAGMYHLDFTSANPTNLPGRGKVSHRNIDYTRDESPLPIEFCIALAKHGLSRSITY